LRRPDITDAIRRGMAARCERTGITADRVLTELARIAFADIGRVVDWGPEGIKLKPKSELSADDIAAIAAVALSPGKGARPRLKLHDKQRALDAIGRHLGLFDKNAPRSKDPQVAAQRSAREQLIERLNRLVADQARQEVEAETAAQANTADATTEDKIQ
jgi:hypothetical protein